MSIEQFKSSRAVLLGQRAIQLGNLSSEEVEVRIQGHYGWVRQMRNGRLYVAMTYTGCVRMQKEVPGYKPPMSYVTNKAGVSKLKFVMVRGEECFAYMGVDQLPAILRAIKQIKNRPAQCRKANGWARR